MPIDPSIAMSGKQPQIDNPLTTMEQYTKLQNQANQNRLFQAHQAAGEALQGAINPATGQADPLAFANAIKNNPQAALAAPDALAQQQKLTQAQLTMRLQQLNYMAGQKAALLTQYPGEIPPTAIVNSIMDAWNQGIITDKGQLAQALTSIPPPGRDGELTNRKFTLQALYANMSAQDQLRNALPQIAQVSGPGGITFKDVSPQTNPSIINSQIPYGLSPAERAQQVPAPPGPNNERRVQTQEEFARSQGLGDALIPPPGQAIPSPTAANPFGSGRFPAALLNRNNPNSAPPPGSAQPPPGGQRTVPGPMPVSMGPAAEAAMTRTGETDADLAKALTTQAQGVPGRQGMLTGMLGDLSDMDTGPNAPAWGGLMARFTQLGIVPASEVEKQASRENFNKLALKYAQDQGQSLGPMTNDKLISSTMSNPNELFTTRGNQRVIHMLQGNEDAIVAKANAWQQAGAPPGGYTKWSAQFNKNFDPRVFWIARMDPIERKNLVNGMNKEDQATFNKNIAFAINNGLISRQQLVGQ